MQATGRPYLQWIDDDGELRRLDIVDRIFIGRVCQGIDETRRILINSPVVSRDHAVIGFIGSNLEIRDLSANGTWVNDVRLTPNSFKYLVDGDVIRVGKTFVCVTDPRNIPARARQDDSPLTSLTMLTNRITTVTNLVADVRGFSSLTQTHTSNQIYSVMKLIFETFGEIVREHNGTVKDFVGDAIFAFWDHDVAPQKEQAILACRTAIKQAHSLNQIRTEVLGASSGTTRLKLGWGITTGEVTISCYGSGMADLALVGDSTNLAFRLSAVANKDIPREILICSQTANLVRDVMSLDDLGSMPIRERTGQEHLYGLLILKDTLPSLRSDHAATKATLIEF
jgi:class 3 adenylate cyclase